MVRCIVALAWLVVLVGLAGPSGCSRDRLDVSRYVSIYPGSPIVEMPGDEARMRVLVRNVSEIKLAELRLEIKCEACRGWRVAPSQIAELIPGDRRSFDVLLQRQPGKAPQRYPLALTLFGSGLPAPAGLDLMVDLSPPPEKGWIDVGQVTLVSGSQRRTATYLLAGIPLLLLVGWLLWRFSRRHPKSPTPPDPHG